MSVLQALDATRVCARWSPEDAASWSRPVPVPPRPVRPAPPRYRWRSLLQNPQALAITGVVGTLVAVDTAARRLLPRTP
jgi:hypothetical protein